MLNDKIVRKIKYWCAKSLVTCGFPSAPLTDNHLQTGKYCDNYPYIFTEASSKLSEELSRSLYERHVRIKKLFSLRDLDLVYSAIHVAIYRVCYIFLFISFSRLIFDTSHWQLIAILCMGSAIIGILTQTASKFYLYVLNSNYPETMCVIETCYLCKDLSKNKLLIRKKEKEFIKLRIKKLSNMIYIYGKVVKINLDFFLHCLKISSTRLIG